MPVMLLNKSNNASFTRQTPRYASLRSLKNLPSYAERIARIMDARLILLRVAIQVVVQQY